VLIDRARPNSAIAVARRPGEFIARIDFDAMQVTTLQMINSQFVVNGHAMLSADFVTLLVTENDAMSGEGFIGVYDAASLKCRGRYATSGVGPHALVSEPDGSLLVANGGVLTRTQTGRTKLNLDGIDASLVRLDAVGRMLGQWRLSEPDLSIRHLARSRDGTIGVALQLERPTPDQRAPVFAWFDGQELRCGENPEIALGGYGGDAACVETPNGPLFAVGCTHAGLVALWNSSGQFCGAYPLRSACALTAKGDTLVALSEHGEVGVLATQKRTQWDVAHGAPAWDNHASVWAA
jgi:hypothetical protein